MISAISAGIERVSSGRAAQLSGYTQDYIGQLCRDGRIECKRVAGEWHVLLSSLLAYKARFNPVHPASAHEILKSQQAHGSDADQSVAGHEEVLNHEGKKMISSALAAQISGYTQDYIGQLARSKTVDGKKMGRKWFVDREQLLTHKEHNDGLLAALQTQSVGVARLGGGRSVLSPDEDELDVQQKGGNRIPIVTYKRSDGSTINSCEEGTNDSIIIKKDASRKNEISKNNGFPIEKPVSMPRNQGSDVLHVIGSADKQGFNGFGAIVAFLVIVLSLIWIALMFAYPDTVKVGLQNILHTGTGAPQSAYLTKVLGLFEGVVRYAQ